MTSDRRGARPERGQGHFRAWPRAEPQLLHVLPAEDLQDLLRFVRKVDRATPTDARLLVEDVVLELRRRRT